MEQFTKDERENILLELKTGSIGLRIDPPLPCCVLYPVPCLNKATVIVIEMTASGYYRFNPPLCKECAIKMAELYRDNINPDDR